MTEFSCETVALSTAQARCGSLARAALQPAREGAACIHARADLLGWCGAELSQPGAREIVMAKGQMRSNKEKKKPKADKNLKKGGAAPSPFSSGKTPAGQSPNSRKS